MRADALVLLTTVDGLLGPDGRRIREISRFRNVAKLVHPGEKGNLSRGGMSSKLKAVRAASGIDTWIANGRRASLVPIFAGKSVGTFFPASTVG